ncbi:hypothetical protein [Desulfobacula sp.]|uniref:hypothetical protein n=1 Tax=Desulfobacula sp. TaxID=2593537 RepID=UPI0026076F0A|nr:hypothetical protein [Desulfobacula sp.]
MPDKWGRVGYNDFMGIAQTLNGIQAMGQRNTTFNQQQQDRKTKLDEKGQYQTALTGLQGTGELPEGTPAHVGIAAKQSYATGLEADKSIKGAKESKEYDSKMEALYQWRSANKDADWEKAPLDLYSGAQGHKAYATLIDQEAQSEQGRTQIMQNRLARTKQAFGQFQATKGYINEALSQGDIDKAVNGIEKMSQELPLPYQVGEYDPETKTFSVQYLDSPSGKFQETGRRSLQEVVSQLNTTGEKEFVGQLAKGFETTRQGNLEKRMNPMYGKNAKGSRYLIIPQKNVLNPNQVEIEVRNEKTNEKIMFSSWEALQDAGITVENLKREKALGDVALNTQKIATSKAAMGAHNRAGEKDRIETSTKMTKKFKADLSFVLTPFVKPGTDISAMFDGDGMTSQGKGALEAAMSFYEKNSNAEGLSKTDQMKLEKAKSAIQLYNGMSQNIISQYNQQPGEPKKPGPNTPPVKGAKKAKDGDWYVKQGDGWARIQQSYRDLEGLHNKKESAMNGGQQAQPDPPPPQPQPNAPQQIRPELPQDISQWNVQVIPQNGQRIPVVITDQGPIPLTPEEVEMYKEFSAQQRTQAIGAGVDWFKRNATGTQKLSR